MVKNKYGMEIPNNILVQYYNDLIGEFYKSLNIYEGRDYKTKYIIYTSEESYQNYKNFVQNFLYEICGGYYIFDNNSKFLKLLNILQGMLNIKIGQHKQLKSLVFSCIDICNKMKEGIEVEP